MWCQGHLLSAGFHGNILQHDLLTLTVKVRVAWKANKNSVLSKTLISSFESRQLAEFQKRVSANSGVIWCVAANPGGSQIAVR